METPWPLCATCSMVMKFFLICKCNFFYFNSSPSPIALSLSTTEKKLALSSLLLTPKYLYTLMSHEPSFLQAEKSQLSQPLLVGQMPYTLIVIMALCWTGSTKPMSLVLGIPELDLTLQIWLQQCFRRWKGSPPSAFCQ